MNQTIMIQASQAEKNRAAAASKYKKEQDKGETSGAGTLSSQPRVSDNGPGKKEYNNKVYVGGLIEKLNQVSESDIRQVFYQSND